MAMELPHNVSSSAAVLQHKLQAFRALRGLHKGSAVVGQYQAYSAQVRGELQKPESFHSLTPTFAGALRVGPPGCQLPGRGARGGIGIRVLRALSPSLGRLQFAGHLVDSLGTRPPTGGQACGGCRKVLPARTGQADPRGAPVQPPK